MQMVLHRIKHMSESLLINPLPVLFIETIGRLVGDMHSVDIWLIEKEGSGATVVGVKNEREMGVGIHLSERATSD